jgi:hypothetical protein
MKLKIEQEFTDKYTEEKYSVGSEVEFKEERGRELLDDPRGVVTLIKEEAKKEEKPQTKAKAKSKK